MENKRAKNLENSAKCEYKPIFLYSIKNSILPKMSLTTFLHSADDMCFTSNFLINLNTFLIKRTLASIEKSQFLKIVKEIPFWICIFENTGKIFICSSPWKNPAQVVIVILISEEWLLGLTDSGYQDDYVLRSGYFIILIYILWMNSLCISIAGMLWLCSDDIIVELWGLWWDFVFSSVTRCCIVSSINCIVISIKNYHDYVR